MRRPSSQPRTVKLATGVDVRGHRQVREEAQLLMDDRDATASRLGRGAERDGLAADEDSPASGATGPGEDLDERALARSVLPHEPMDGPGPIRGSHPAAPGRRRSA